jgi:hypothetical protein
VELEQRNWTQIGRDNPNLDCLIVVGTKAWVRADVWGDAAGTAPAVTSVRALAFDRFLRYLEPFKSIFKRIFWFARLVYGMPGGLSEPGDAELHSDQSISPGHRWELAAIV